MTTTDDWTYGAEHEWADWRRDAPLPPGYVLDTKDTTMVNSNGIAVDPKGVVYGYGGEIQSNPTRTIWQQVGEFVQLKQLLRAHGPAPTVNYRSNLHIHIRVPGLKDDLPTLRRLLDYNGRWLPVVLPIIEPIPRPTRTEYPNPEAYRGAMQRFTRRLRSHHYVVPPRQRENQLRAPTVEAFHLAEHVRFASRHITPRAAVNLRQLRETDTIEFRHWPGTLSTEQFRSALLWCQRYLMLAFADQSPETAALEWRRDHEALPFMPYRHDLEQRYRATKADGPPLAARRHAAARILEGTWE